MDPPSLPNSSLHLQLLASDNRPLTTKRFRIAVLALTPRSRSTMVAYLRVRVASAFEVPVGVALARRAGISSGHISQIVNGLGDPSPDVLKRLHGVLFRRTRSEARVVPAVVKVLGWRKGVRRGILVRGAGGPGGEPIRVGGRVPWGAEAEYACRAGYDGRGELSCDTVAVPSCSDMLVRPEAPAA